MVEIVKDSNPVDKTKLDPQKVRTPDHPRVSHIQGGKLQSVSPLGTPNPFPWESLKPRDVRCGTPQISSSQTQGGPNALSPGMGSCREDVCVLGLWEPHS